MRNLQPRDCLLGQSPDENPWHNRAAQCAAPTGETVPSRRAAKGRPYSGKQTRSVGSVKPGAPTGPHQPKFLQTQGPVARREFRPATQILRAGNFSRVYRRTSPVMGSGESGPMGTKCPSAASPVAFWLLCRHGQSNSPPERRNIPAQTIPERRRAESLRPTRHPNSDPSSAPFGGTFPPRGKAKKEQVATPKKILPRLPE